MFPVQRLSLASNWKSQPDKRNIDLSLHSVTCLDAAIWNSAASRQWAYTIPIVFGNREERSRTSNVLSSKLASARPLTSRKEFNNQRRCMRHSTSIHLVTKSTRWIYITNKILAKDPSKTLKEDIHDKPRVSTRHAGYPSCPFLPRRQSIYLQNRSWATCVDTQSDRSHW